MSDLFVPVRRVREAPFRERSLLTAGCACFGPDQDGFRVYVSDEALTALATGTRQAAPKEAFGLLVGRTFSDGQGMYTVVTGAVYARRLSSGAAHVKLSESEMSELKRSAYTAYPSEDHVGWTHAHPWSSGYSGVDRDEQSTWPSLHHVGLLTSMEGEPWLRAYRGPHSSALPDAQVPRPAAQAVPRIPSITAGPPGNVDDLMRIPARSPGQAENRAPGRRRKLVVVVVATGMLVATAMLVAAGGYFRLHSRLSTVESALVTLSRNERPGARPVSAPLKWWCDPSNGPAPLPVKCTAPADQGITGWLWDFGGVVRHGGPVMTHVFSTPGKFKMGLIVLTTTGSVNGPPIEVQVSDAPRAESPRRSRGDGSGRVGEPVRSGRGGHPDPADRRRAGNLVAPAEKSVAERPGGARGTDPSGALDQAAGHPY